MVPAVLGLRCKGEPGDHMPEVAGGLESFCPLWQPLLWSVHLSIMRNVTAWETSDPGETGLKFLKDQRFQLILRCNFSGGGRDGAIVASCLASLPVLVFSPLTTGFRLSYIHTTIKSYYYKKAYISKIV